MIAIPDGYYYVVSIVMAAILGLCVGSFLNVVIYRLPRKMNLAFPPSHCPNCDYTLKWYDNIPIFSYLFLKGSCRNCHEHITFRYTAVEAINALLWVFSVIWFQDNLLLAVVSSLIFSVCICMFCIDLEMMIVPDILQIILAVLIIPTFFLTPDWPWATHLIGFVVATVLMWGTSLLMEKILGREALGGADIKLTMICGALLGWKKLIIMMLIASISGCIVMAVRKHKAGESLETPFVPFLTVGMAVAYVFGDLILQAYEEALINLVLTFM